MNQGKIMDLWNSGRNGLLHLLTGMVLAIASGLPGPVLAQSGSSAVYYLHTDHLNTPRLATDEQNQVVWRNLPLAEPFGNNPPEEDPDVNGVPFNLNLRFPGQYFDKETNLNYNYFRDYDPATGRYIQSDPIGLQGGINTYGYANQNPLSFIDPLGLSSDDPLGGGGSAGFPLGFPDASAQAQRQLAQQLTQMLRNLADRLSNSDQCRCKQATPQNIQAVLQSSPMFTLQPSVFASGVQGYVTQIESGVMPSPIWVDGNVIVDGNHRYIAGLLCDKPVSIQPWTAPLIRPRMPVRDLKVVP